MQTIAPTTGMVFAKPEEVAKTTTSGFFIPKDSQGERSVAEVLNVGPGVKGISQKDTVIYRKYAATEITLNNKSYIIIPADDIIGVVLEVNE